MKIQQYQRQATQPATAGGIVVSGAGTSKAASAQAIGAASQATMELAERSQAAARTALVSSRSLALRQQYGSYFADRSRDAAQWDSLESDAAHAYGKLTEQAMKGIEDPLAQAAMAQEINTFGAQASIEAQKAKITQQIDWSRGMLEAQMSERRIEIAGTTNQVERQRLQGQAFEIIAGNAAAGVISPLDAEKKIRAFTDGVIEDQFSLMTYQDPDGVLERLYNTADEALASMSSDKRADLILRAEKRSEAMRKQDEAERRRATAADERTVTDLHDLNYGRLYAAVDQGDANFGTLTQALEDNKISGTQFKTLYDRAAVVAEAGGPGNRQAVNNLKMRVWGGTLTPGMILDSKRGVGGINTAEAETLLALTREGSAFTQTEDYKQAADYLQSQLGYTPGSILGGSDSSATAANAKAALYEFYIRMKENQSAVPQNVMMEVLERFQAKGVKPKPVPTRFKTPDAAINALRDGRINSIDELNFEIELHNQQPNRQP